MLLNVYLLQIYCLQFVLYSSKAKTLKSFIRGGSVVSVDNIPIFTTNDLNLSNVTPLDVYVTTSFAVLNINSLISLVFNE